MKNHYQPCMTKLLFPPTNNIIDTRSWCMIVSMEKDSSFPPPQSMENFILSLGCSWLVGQWLWRASPILISPPPKAPTLSFLSSCGISLFLAHNDRHTKTLLFRRLKNNSQNKNIFDLIKASLFSFEKWFWSEFKVLLLKLSNLR